LVQAAIEEGRWTDEDRAQLRRARLSLSAHDFEELLGSLVPAINLGKVKVAAAGPPL